MFLPSTSAWPWQVSRPRINSPFRCQSPLWEVWGVGPHLQPRPLPYHAHPQPPGGRGRRCSARNRRNRPPWAWLCGDHAHPPRAACPAMDWSTVKCALVAVVAVAAAAGVGPTSPESGTQTFRPISTIRQRCPALPQYEVFRPEWNPMMDYFRPNWSSTPPSCPSRCRCWSSPAVNKVSFRKSPITHLN